MNRKDVHFTDKPFEIPCGECGKKEVQVSYTDSETGKREYRCLKCWTGVVQLPFPLEQE